MTARILVVDDEPDLEALVVQKFRHQIREGALVFLFAHDGVEALKLLQATPDIDMVITDINMPGMSGLELLPKAKAARPDVPIIMITAYGDAETKRKALEGGAEALLTKPIDFGMLRNEVETRVGRTA